MFDGLMIGLQSVASVQTISLIIVGTALGIIVGVIPGFSTTMGLVLALPFTFSLGSMDGLALMLGLMAGGLSGGLISAVLLGIPGTAAAVATVFDGHPMSENGEPGRALAIGTWASFLGGIIGALLLIFCMPLLSDAALAFGPWEFFSVILLGLTIIASLAGRELIKGLIAGILGLLIGCVGPDPVFGIARLSFNLPVLSNGIHYLAVLIGLFAYPQLVKAVEPEVLGRQFEMLNRDITFSNIQVLKDVWKNLRVLFVSSFIGAFFGALPGVGAASANIVAYDQAKKISPYKDKFGTGFAGGIIASESSNNALGGGSLIPAMALGIPGDAMTAVMLGALVLHGIQPGPMLIFEQAPLVYGIFVAYIIANVVMLLIQLYGVRLFVQITKIPNHHLASSIFVVCTVGAFSIQNHYTDIWIACLVGIGGYIFIKNGFPLAPIILGAILGPMAEVNFRRALITDPDWMLFFTRPLSGIFILCAILSLAYPIYKNWKLSRLKDNPAEIQVPEE
ncbi:MAG: tripartite tricarboxylate transporter permease [Desulfovibrio sp.]|jgi:putative tricarboxylic transport membrane protein|nr:tripartite tricarboxylate transporter permease [Desulfovibrio sp.]